MKPALIHINGHPGVGNRTIERLVAAEIGAKPADVSGTAADRGQILR